MLQKKLLNLFYPNVPFLYPLKTSENQNQRFSDIFKGIEQKSIQIQQLFLQCWLLTQHNALFLYSLKMSENQSFSDVFRGYRNGPLG